MKIITNLFLFAVFESELNFQQCLPRAKSIFLINLFEEIRTDVRLDS